MFTVDGDPQPFAKGDILIAATAIDDSNIDFRNLRGPGRILHFDKEFNRKSVLWTDHDGLVVNLAVDPRTDILYSVDPTGRHVVPFGPDAARLPDVDYLPARPLGALVFTGNGDAYIGVHSARGPVPDDKYGAAKLFRFSTADQSVTAIDVDVDGGHTGWLGVNYMALHPNGRVLYMASEGGHRILRYDLDAAKMLPDYVAYGDQDRDRTFGFAFLDDQNVVMVTGADLVIRDEAAQETVRIHLGDKGWTRVIPAHDKKTAFVINFLEGRLQRRRINDGALLFEYNLGRKCSMCGLVEY